MNIVFLNGSPKPSGGNSAIFSEFLKKAIAKIKPDVNFTLLNIRTNMLVEADYELFETCDALVIAYPLYMDAFPSHLSSQLLRLEEWFNSRKGEKSAAKNRLVVYGLCNCGFYEGERTSLSFDMLKIWCKKCGLIWGQGAGAGGGELLCTLPQIVMGHGPLRSVGKNISKLALSVVNGLSGENLYSKPDMPRFMFTASANSMIWEAKAKKNGLTKKQMLYRIP